MGCQRQQGPPLSVLILSAHTWTITQTRRVAFLCAKQVEMLINVNDEDSKLAKSMISGKKG